MVDDNGKKTITNGIIIDGALEEAREIMTFLYSIKWSEKYRNVNFVPFRTSQNFTVKDQKRAMEHHNNYLNSTYRKLVKVQNPDVDYQSEDGDTISFKNWLTQSQLHGSHMIDGVEKMKDGIVRIIYDKKHQQGVDYIMTHLRDNAVDAFGEKVANEMLGEDFDVVTHFSSELEDQHADKIKATWNSGPPQHISPPKQHHRLYYGSNKSENLYQHTDTKSYSEITQSTLTNSETQMVDTQRENDELRNMVMDLKNKFDSLEQKHSSFQKNLKASLKRELLQEFEGVINDFRKEMNNTTTTIENKFDKTITTIENKFDTTIKQYEEKAVKREERMQAQGLSNFRIVAAELLKNSNLMTPSEAPESVDDLRGESQ